LILIFLTRKLFKAQIVLAQNSGENSANVVMNAMYFYFDFNIFNVQNSQYPVYFSSKYKKKMILNSS
jgi:hypothetical protein